MKEGRRGVGAAVPMAGRVRVQHWSRCGQMRGRCGGSRCVAQHRLCEQTRRLQMRRTSMFDPSMPRIHGWHGRRSHGAHGAVRARCARRAARGAGAGGAARRSTDPLPTRSDASSAGPAVLLASPASAAAAADAAAVRARIAAAQCSRQAAKRQLAPYGQVSGPPPGAVALGHVKLPQPGSTKARAATR